jgi:hypothetical protein
VFAEERPAAVAAVQQWVLAGSGEPVFVSPE